MKGISQMNETKAVRNIFLSFIFLSFDQQWHATINPS